jgi:hypothetical protein
MPEDIIGRIRDELRWLTLSEVFDEGEDEFEDEVIFPDQSVSFKQVCMSTAV